MHSSTENLSAVRLQTLLLWTGWFAVAFFVIFKTTTQTNYAVMSTSIAGDYGLTLGEIGVLGSVYVIGFTLMTIPAGALLDFYNPRYVLSLSVLTVTLGAVVFALASDWTMVCVGQFIMGVGGAFGYPALGYFTRHAFGVRRFTFMMAMAGVVGALFATLTQGSVASLLNTFDWREITLGLAGFGFFLATLMFFVVEDETDVPHTGNKSLGGFFFALRRDLKEVAVMPRMWGSALVGGVGFSAYMAVGVIWGVQLLQEQGYVATDAGHIGSLIWIGGGIGAPLIAMLNTKMNSFKYPTIIFSLGSAISLAILCFLGSESPFLSSTFMVLTGIFGGGATVLGFGYGMQLCDLRLAGTVTAFINFLLFVVSGVMMVIPGKMVDHGLGDSLSVTLLVFPVLLTIVALLVALFYREDIFPNAAPEG